MSREEYLKKYLSTSVSSLGDKQKKKKKPKENSDGNQSRRTGMRLLDDDTYLPSKPGKKSAAALKTFEFSSDEDFDDNSEEEGEEEMDEIERAVRMLNRKSAAKSKKKSEGQAEPTFKTDSFITVEEGGTSEMAKIAKPEKIVVKTEIKEEAESEDEERSTRRHHQQKRRTMDDGRRAGLVSKEAMREEIAKRVEAERREREREERERQKSKTGNVKTEETGGDGRDAEEMGPRKRTTGFNRDARKNRQREGEAGGAEAVAEKEARKEREAAKQAELEAKYAHWNRGITQKKEREERLEEMERTLAEGFTRYADDEAMNEHLKEQLHEDDPMADYFRLKNHKVQMRTGVVYPTYQGQFLANRYGIPPGYRWDGVDRSNGFEAKLALEKNKKTARESDTYRAIQECEQ